MLLSSALEVMRYSAAVLQRTIARGTTVVCHDIKLSLSFTAYSKRILIRLRMLERLVTELISP